MHKYLLISAIMILSSCVNDPVCDKLDFAGNYDVKKVEYYDEIIFPRTDNSKSLVDSIIRKDSVAIYSTELLLEKTGRFLLKSELVLDSAGYWKHGVWENRCYVKLYFENLNSVPTLWANKGGYYTLVFPRISSESETMPYRLTFRKNKELK